LLLSFNLPLLLSFNLLLLLPLLLLLSFNLAFAAVFQSFVKGTASAVPQPAGMSECRFKY